MVTINKKLVVLGMLLAVKGAYAQSSGTTTVELYGTIDAGIGHAQYSLSSDPNFAVGLASVATPHATSGVTTLVNGGISPSNFGIKGSEDLGGGLKAIFKLESGFNSWNGVLNNGIASLVNNKSTNNQTVNGDSNLAGQFFNRAAIVGLSSSDWGTITFGRNATVGVEALIDFDPMGASYLFGPFGYYGSPAGAGYTEDGRIDSSIRYKYEANGFNVEALYKFGGQAGATSAQQEMQIGGGYKSGPFAVQVAYSKANDALAASSTPTGGNVNLTAADTTAFFLAGSYAIDNFKFMAGYERITYQNPSNPAADLAINIALGGYPVNSVNVTAFNKEKVEPIYFVGGIYSATPALALKLGLYDLHNEDFNSSATPCNGSNNNLSSCSGDAKWVAFMGTYALSKRTSLYAGYSYNKNSGGQAAGYVNDSNSVFALGMNTKF